MPMMMMGDEKNKNDVDLILSKSLMNDMEDEEGIDAYSAEMMSKDDMMNAVRDIKNAVTSGNDDRLFAALTNFMDGYMQGREIQESMEME